MKRRNSLMKICTYVLACVILLSCSRSKELRSTEVDTGPPEIKYEPENPASSGDFPPPEAGERDFYKIQVLATNSFERAQDEKIKLMSYTDKTIYITSEDVLWKVQIGDYISRKESEMERDQLRGLGWIDAWIMNYRASVIQTEIQSDEAEMPDESEESYYYTVQLVATRSKDKAEGTVSKFIGS